MCNLSLWMQFWQLFKLFRIMNLWRHHTKDRLLLLWAPGHPVDRHEWPRGLWETSHTDHGELPGYVKGVRKQVYTLRPTKKWVHCMGWRRVKDKFGKSLKKQVQIDFYLRKIKKYNCCSCLTSPYSWFRQLRLLLFGLALFASVFSLNKCDNV